MSVFYITLDKDICQHDSIGHRRSSSDAAQFTIAVDGSKALCYGMHGSPNDFYNIISDTCISVNVHFTQHPDRNNENRISSIGIRAITDDADTPFADIQIDLMNCSARINTETIYGSKIIGKVSVARIGNGWRVSFNSNHPYSVMWITCEEDMLRFDVYRCCSHNFISHGLLGKAIYLRVFRNTYVPTTITINLIFVLYKTLIHVVRSIW